MVVSFLLGMMLAQRCTVVILLPAIALVLALTVSSEIASADAAWVIVSDTMAAIASLQLGYLAGLVTRHLVEAATPSVLRRSAGSVSICTAPDTLQLAGAGRSRAGGKGLPHATLPIQRSATSLGGCDTRRRRAARTLALTSGVPSLPGRWPSLIASMSATVNWSRISDMASRTLLMAIRTVQVLTSTQSRQGR
jgi:hypothetical protein